MLDPNALKAKRVYSCLNDFMERVRNGVFLHLLTLKLENQYFSQRLCFQSFSSCSQVSSQTVLNYSSVWCLVTFTGSSAVLM